MSKDIDTSLDSIFTLTEKILENQEMKILKYNNKQIIPEIPFLNNFLNKIFYLIGKYIIYPFKYLSVGAKDFFKPFLIWSMLSFIFLFMFSLFIQHPNNLSQGFNSFILNIILVIPMFLVIFSVPTTYAFYGLDNKTIMEITNDFRCLNLNNKITIEYIEKNLEKVYSRVIARYTAYKWIIGSIWFISVYFITMEMRIGLKIPEAPWMKVLQDSITSFSFLLLFTLFAILILTSYRRASDILFKSIEFSLIELKYQIDLKENEVKKP